MKKTVYIGWEKADPGDYEKIEDTGRFWNDKNLDMVKLTGEWYLLYGWNGWTYTKCWKYKDRDGKNRADNKLYELTPAQVGAGEPNEYGEYQQYDTVGYKIAREYK